MAAFAAGEPTPMPIWPSGPPGDTSNFGAQTDNITPSTRLIAGRPFNQLTNIINPTISIFRPPKEKDSGTAVLVFPGGSYRILAIDMEGTEICQWLNSIGITAILLRYRVPARPGKPNYADPLQDAQRAVGLVRSHAEEWHINPNRIGVLGFSAGGHLAAAVSNNYEKRSYPAQDAADSVSCRPDFTVLIYPAYLASRTEVGKLSPEIAVTANTPPAFLIQAEDDPVRVENCLYYFLALKNAKVPAEMHLYATGGHGYGMRPTGEPIAAWPSLAEKWFHTRGLLGAK